MTRSQKITTLILTSISLIGVALPGQAQTPNSGHHALLKVSTGSDGPGLCASRGLAMMNLKDPYSAKVTVDPKRRFASIEYAGQPLTVRAYLMIVNAKNSYGAYTGSKGYMCYLNESETRILRVDPAP